MRVFRRHRPGPRGARTPYGAWIVELRDHRDVLRRIAAFKDKGASEELGRKVERLASLRRSGLGPDVELSRWLGDAAPRAVVERLASWGLVEPARAAAGRSIEELLADFGATLAARDRTGKHVKLTVARVRSVVEAIGARSLSDITPDRIERHLAARRSTGLATKTSNHVLAAVKEFSGWAVTSGLATFDPLVVLRPLNARVDPRRERRALGFADELPRLIEAAAAGPVYRGVAGPVRALVYRLAAETGLRVAELCSLRAGDVDLSPGRPCIALRAAAEKSRRGATLALLPATAAELAPYVAGKLPRASLFGLPKAFPDKATRWLRFDLEAAGVPYVDESGRVADFHALRASFVTALVRSGTDARTVQALARHTSPTTTLSLYAKLGRDDERQALERLPALPSSKVDEAASATGTTDSTDGAGVQVSHGPIRDASRCRSVPSDALPAALQAAEVLAGRPVVIGGGGNRTRVP